MIDGYIVSVTSFSDGRGGVEGRYKPICYDRNCYCLSYLGKRLM